MDLKGRTALITGGSRGIGKGIALIMAKHGADVIINYRREEDAARATVKEIESFGVKALALQANVANFDEVELMVTRAIDSMEKIDILVCNAGILSRGQLLAETEVKEMHRLIDVHVFGAFHCIRTVLPHMQKQPRGDVIIMSSRATQLYAPGAGPYTIAKAALEAMAKCLSNEERKHNIRVNVIAPGLVDTKMGEQLAKGSFGVELSSISNKQAFGRVGRPEDIGNLAAFLCSTEGEYISGQVIYIHGGDVSSPRT